jgi:glycosyltransferase involved in cell wall biosynthesis
MNNPFFTIITTNYNGEQFLAQCLESVKNQTFQNFEHIVINDCSPNKFYNKSFLEIVNEYKYNQIDNLKYIDLDKNIGASSARNKVLDIAKGQFILVLDGDDYYLPTHLESIYNELILNDNFWDNSIFLLKDGMPFKMSEDSKIEYLKKPMIEQAPKHRTILTELVYFSTTMPLMCIPRVVLSENRFDSTIQLGEEPDLVFKIVFQRREKGLSDLQFKVIDVESVMYRKHNNSATCVDSQKGNKKEALNYKIIYNKIIQNHNSKFLEKFLAYIGIFRYSLNQNSFTKLIKKFLTLFAKIFTGWYL